MRVHSFILVFLGYTTFVVVAYPPVDHIHLETEQRYQTLGFAKSIGWSLLYCRVLVTDSFCRIQRKSRASG